MSLLTLCLPGFVKAPGTTSNACGSSLSLPLVVGIILRGGVTLPALSGVSVGVDDLVTLPGVQGEAFCLGARLDCVGRRVERDRCREGEERGADGQNKSDGDTHCGLEG